MSLKIKSVLRACLPRLVQPHRILAGPLRGARIVTSWHDYPAAILGSTERPLLRWFEKNVRAGETWLDVGAHYGYTAIALCNLVGQAGRVFAFEPMISTAGYLIQTRALNRFAQLSVAPFALNDSATFERLLLPTSRGMADSTLTPQGKWHESILAARLDWLWPQLCGGYDRVDGVKIDVQAMEIGTLRGMQSALKTNKPKLVVELHHGVSRESLLTLLEGLGYCREGIPVEPVEGEIQPRYVDDRTYEFRPR